MLFKKTLHSIAEFQSAGNVLRKQIGLETEIVALKYIREISEIPEGYMRPVKDLNQKMTICMAMAGARKEHAKWAITSDDNPCTPISVVHGWARAPFWALIKSQVDNKWQKNAASVIRINTKRKKLGGLLAQYPFNRFLKHKGALISPLSKTDFIPDTVVIYGNPEQMLHVTHAFSFEGKYIPKAILAGYGESCFVAGLIPLKSKQPIFTLLGMGDRTLGRAKSYEVAMGMPGALVFYIVENLFKSGGEYNLKSSLENPIPLDQLDESILPGWTAIRKCIGSR